MVIIVILWCASAGLMFFNAIQAFDDGENPALGVLYLICAALFLYVGLSVGSGA